MQLLVFLPTTGSLSTACVLLYYRASADRPVVCRDVPSGVTEWM